MKTRGALLWAVDQPWSVEDVEIGEPGCGEVMVKLEAAGLCHSDHHLATGSLPSDGFPILGGHEGAGVVTAVGAGVESVAVGDHVVLCAGASCGTFAPFAMVNARQVVKIDPAIPSTVACLLGCAVLTGYGAATRSADVRPGEDVAVIGLGGVGMSAVLGAVGAGARRVFAIDPAEWKRDKAMALGATHGYADVQTAIGGIAEATQGLMATKVIVAVGKVDGKDVDNWLILTAKGGTCVLAALGDLAATDVTANLAMNILLQKRLQGSLLGGGNPHHDIALVASMYSAGKLNLEDMVTREYRLDQINDGFEDMLAGNLIRGVIRYTEQDWSTG